MYRRSIHSYIRHISMLLGLGLLMTSTYAAGPLWTMVPAPGMNPIQTVAENAVGNMQYIVHNESLKPKKLAIKPMHGVRQIAPCELKSKGQEGSSCILNLAIVGNALPLEGIHGGPILCQTNPDGSPNPNQCFQPSSANILHITRGSSANKITVDPSSLSFVQGDNGFITVTNDDTSPEAAVNVVATIPNGSGITIQSTTCSSNLPIGASCTITFSASVPEGPTTIVISGSNTNTASVSVIVSPVPIATINVNPTTVLFAENSTGSVTVTNSNNSLVMAENVVATIPGSSNISIQSTTCGATLAIGASCSITFASSTQEGPIPIVVAGDNTNTENINVTVTSAPQISITGPAQQSRVLTVSGMTPLSLVITNDAGSAVNANAITVSNKAACPNVTIVDDTGCESVAPGASCTLSLTSNTPYIPCTITVSGSNTAANLQTLIAFSHLGGLVFEESSGSGKVVIDAAQAFTMQWLGDPVNVPGAASLDDGNSNTTAIIAEPECSGDPNFCAAIRCRSISADWYLPARNELTAIYNALCTNAAIPCNFGDFSASLYLSSSQQDQDFVFAVTFPTGSNVVTLKDDPRPVRCVRAFTP